MESGCVFIELYQFTNHSMANYLEFEYLVVSLLSLGFLIHVFKKKKGQYDCRQNNIVYRTYLSNFILYVLTAN